MMDYAWTSFTGTSGNDLDDPGYLSQLQSFNDTGSEDTLTGVHHSWPTDQLSSDDSPPGGPSSAVAQAAKVDRSSFGPRYTRLRLLAWDAGPEDKRGGGGAPGHNLTLQKAGGKRQGQARR